MTVYYTQESFSSNGKQKITSFKPVNRPLWNHSYERLTAVGIPYDSWQLSRWWWKSTYRPPVCLLRNERDEIPRASQLPYQTMQGRYHDCPSLSCVSGLWQLLFSICWQQLGAGTAKTSTGPTTSLICSTRWKRHFNPPALAQLRTLFASHR
jgi:hypothetical protein